MVTIGFVGLVLGFSEGLLLAEKNDIPRETAINTRLNSVIAFPSLKS